MATAKQSPVTEITPFDEQQPFLGTNKKYYGYISGVGAGKTFSGIIRTILNMVEWNPGEMGAIVAPTRQMVINVIIPEMRQLGLFDPPINWEFKSAHTDEPGIHAPNGSRALVLSADNTKTIERLRGLNLAWFWIDEEAEVPPRAREILTQRIRVGQYRNGYVTTTPQGKNHTYDFFVGDHEGEYKQHGEADVYECEDRIALLRVPSHANPHNPEDYLEGLEKDHEGQRYEQEVLGDFVQFEGLIHNWYSENTHVVSNRLQNPRETIYGVDWGHNNPAVILCLQRHPADERHTVDNTLVWTVVDEFYQSGLTAADLAQQANYMQDQYGPGPFYCDPAQPENIQAFQDAGLDSREAKNPVMPGIQKVQEFGKKGELYIYEDCVKFLNEITQYQYKDNENPKKVNDHTQDALRYALFTHSSSGVNAGIAFGGEY